MREIVLDTETTGLRFREDGDRIIEIGCVELFNHVPNGETFHVYINPERDVPKEAFDIHGISTEFLADKPVFKDVAKDFVDFVAGDPLIIHNAGFDIPFLNFELERAGFPAISFDRVVDTLLIARRKHAGGGNRLDDLCRRYGIDNSRRTYHGALLDSEILAEVYLELIGGRQTAMSLTHQTETENGDPERPVLVKVGKRKRALPPRLSSEDRQRHASFVESLGEHALWSDYRN